jgi:hypothetical protein
MDGWMDGWMGNEDELKYLHQELFARATTTTGQKLRLDVHISSCNVGRTSDGTAAGGQRLAKELNSLLLRNNENDYATTLSLIGNSLGGLYARYAVGSIDWSAGTILPGIFCTLSTPHLGLQNQYNLPVLGNPKSLEPLVANLLQRTGRDLFRLDDDNDQDIIKNLACDAKFLEPLGNFHRRIAYANAYGTDLLVPTATAVFLEGAAESPHVLVEQSAAPFPRVVFETPQKEVSTSGATTTDGSSYLSRRLDALGWTKVFWDLRDIFESERGSHQEQQPVVLAAADQIILTSRDLIDTFCADPLHVRQPLGHTMMVANSKNAIYEYQSSSKGTDVPSWIIWSRTY